MRDAEVELRILRFEQAWRRHEPCEIAGFLDHPCALEGDERRRLLVELICIDLEFCWRNQARDEHLLTRMRLESYVERHPELGAFDDLPIELIGEEYRTRRRWGDRPSHSAFVSRFAAREAEIQAELSRIDVELAEESADERPRSRTLGRSNAWSEIIPDLNVPLCSHQDIHLRRMIGSGSTGKVYQAWQRSASREVAVKFLRRRLLRDQRVVERFIGEATTVAQLRHPNIVAIHGLGSAPAGAYFIVMELVAGPDLAHLAATRTISVSEAVGWAAETCDALGHAHSKGIIHCDLKPANLLLDEHGRIRVTDFGLARHLAGPSSWTAEIEGTAPFMAPEQASPTWGPVDTRTDVYGVGAVLYTLLTGRPPWLGRRLPDVLAKVISAAPVIPPNRLRPDLSDQVNDLCQNCLAKAPDQRYQSVQDLRAALMELSRVVRSDTCSDVY